jgi:hypothetical protein
VTKVERQHSEYIYRGISILAKDEAQDKISYVAAKVSPSRLGTLARDPKEEHDYACDVCVDESEVEYDVPQDEVKAEALHGHCRHLGCHNNPVAVIDSTI